MHPLCVSLLIRTHKTQHFILSLSFSISDIKQTREVPGLAHSFHSRWKHFQLVLDILLELNFLLIASFHVFQMTLYLIMPCGSHPSFFSGRTEYLIRENAIFSSFRSVKKIHQHARRKKQIFLLELILFATKNSILLNYLFGQKSFMPRQTFFRGRLWWCWYYLWPR